MEKQNFTEGIAIKIIRWLLLFNGVAFVVFGLVHFFRGAWVLGSLFIIDAIVFLWLNRVIGRGKKWIFYFAIIFVGVNIILIIIDQFGMIDLFFLLLESILFVMILGNKKRLALR
jgi:hypothetical protein